MKLHHLAVPLLMVLLLLGGCRATSSFPGHIQPAETTDAGPDNRDDGLHVVGAVRDGAGGDAVGTRGGGYPGGDAGCERGVALGHRHHLEHQCPHCGESCSELVGTGPAGDNSGSGPVLAVPETQEKERGMPLTTLGEFSIDAFLGNIGWLVLAFTVGAVLGPMIIRWMNAGFKKVPGGGS